jgi:hypothetical protein
MMYIVLVRDLMLVIKYINENKFEGCLHHVMNFHMESFVQSNYSF